MPGLNPGWIEYVVCWIPPMILSIGINYGLFGLTIQRFQTILVRDGFFLALVVMVDYYGDACPADGYVDLNRDAQSKMGG
jgi:hypothetical protein